MQYSIMMLMGCMLLFSQCEKFEEIEADNGGEEEILPEDVVSATAFYVAPPTATPAGNDNNPGTFDKPWATWKKAFNSGAIHPGDTIYFRGGVYYHTQVEGGYGYGMSRNGIAGHNVHYFNYPGEKPILDCSSVIPEGNINIPLNMRDIHHVHIRGLTLRNVWQADGEDEVIAWKITGSNVIVENCTVYNTHGIAFKSDGSTELYYINCDAYNNCDSLTTVPAANPMPGNDGTGFQDFNWYLTDAKVYYRNCRAWNCGDQGFSSGSVGYTEYDGCWSFNNGQMEGDGHGFKMGWIEEVTPIAVNRLYKNCIAAYNRQNGFTTNDVGYESGSLHVFNNTSYHNGYDYETGNTGYGFYIDNTADSNERERLRVFMNNVSYDDRAGNVHLGSGAEYTHVQNSWDTPPDLVITSGDFISLDSSGLSDPRQEDGSLPETDFLRLRSGSKLIDKGSKSTGLPFNGSAPDLGAFEF